MIPAPGASTRSKNFLVFLPISQDNHIEPENVFFSFRPGAENLPPHATHPWDNAFRSKTIQFAKNFPALAHGCNLLLLLLPWPASTRETTAPAGEENKEP
jgi:hypothetical protein